MKLVPHCSKPGLRKGARPALRRSKRAPLVAVVLSLLVVAPGARTQYLAPPQSPALTGPTLGTNLRNAAAATHAQAGMVRKGADDWGRRAAAGGYESNQFQQDFQTLQFQFRMLRDQFGWLGTLEIGRASCRERV